MAAVLVAGSLAAPAGGAPAGPDAGGQAGRPITLAEAVTYTLDHDPALRITRAVVEARRGVLQEVGGAFDLTADATVAYERSQGELRSFQIELEEAKRDLQRQLFEEFTLVADDLARQLADPTALPIPRCPEGREAIFIDGVNICVSDVERANLQLFDEALQDLIAESEDPESRDALEAIRQRQLDLYRQIVTQVIDILRFEARAAEQRLINLGVVPEIQQRHTLLLDARLRRLLRNGLEPSCGLILESVEDNFDGKPLSASFGGKGIPNTFTSFAGCMLQAPLGKGLGRGVVEAPERAAELSYRASRQQLVQTAAERALVTALAYWRLAEAQARHELLEESLATEEELAEAARALIEGDEIPPSELDRVEARLASARQDLAAARRGVVEARLGLAAAMGLPVAALAESPLAVDPLPWEPVAAPPPAEPALVIDALGRRRDVLALQNLQAASGLLSAAARRELRRRFDLTLVVGYSGLHESFDREIYDLGGFGEALTGKQTGPSALLSFSVDFPFANRLARGRLARAEALHSQSRVRSRELERTVRLRVVELAGSVRRAAGEVRRRRQAVARFEQTLADALAVFRAGEATLVDTILTEEQLTAARLEAVAARGAYAALLASLRFERGRLVTGGAGEGELRFEELAPDAGGGREG